VSTVDKIVAAMRKNPHNVRYDDLHRVCEHYFGPARSSGGSHAVFRPRGPATHAVNIQNSSGQAKPYQVRQVLAAIDKKEAK
jgi:hypothetical protein